MAASNGCIPGKQMLGEQFETATTFLSNMLGALCIAEFGASLPDGRAKPAVTTKLLNLNNPSGFSQSPKIKKSPYDLDFLRNCIRLRDTAVSCTRRHLRYVPRGIPPSTTRLNLTDNLFQVLGPKTFPQLYRLEILDLSKNLISSILSGSFKNTYNLTKLYLNHNNISAILKGAFDGLVRLEYLELAFTRLSNLDRVEFLTPNLKSLNFTSFAGNGVTRCKLGSEFRHLKQLAHLDLAYNDIAELEHDCFAALDESRVQALDLSFNKIQTIRHPVFWPFRNLAYLFLDGNRLDMKTLNTTFDNLNSIETTSLHLSLSNSTFLAGVKTPSNTTFARLANLSITQLDLSHVGLQFLPESGLFSFFPRLESLILVGNNITALPPKAFSGLGRLQTLDMSKNDHFENVPNGSFVSLDNLTSLSLTLAKGRSDIHGSVFFNLPNLRSLTISGPETKHAVGRFTKFSLRGLKYLESLIVDWNDLPEVPTTALQPVKATLRKLGFPRGHISELETQTFLGFNRLESLDFWFNKISALPENAFEGLENLEETSRPFDNLTSLEVLDLSQNNFDTLTALPFENLHNLTSLDLSSNRIPSIPNRLFKYLPKLRTLKLHSNRQLGKLPRNVFGFLQNLEKLNLEDNPLQCTCEEEWFYDWVVSNRTKTLFYNLSNYGCVAPERLVHKTILDFDPEAQGCHDKTGIRVAISFAVLLVVFLLGVFVGYKNRWYIKYGCFVIKARFHGYQALRDSNTQKKFDAFVSYNHHDRAWVMDELVPHLEEEEGSEFRLCLDYRDFVGGAPITDNIVNAIYDSRKTICLVTEEFLKSEWCEMEVQMATYRLFDEQIMLMTEKHGTCPRLTNLPLETVYTGKTEECVTESNLKECKITILCRRRLLDWLPEFSPCTVPQVDVLILVFLEDIPDRALHRYHRLRRLMCKRTYLEWPKDPQGKALFWQRLKDALKTGDRPPIENII
ncbi:TIR domain [Branchiostoma belcheri]|nr:TIR domain [Branchiostoma belcheri]